MHRHSIAPLAAGERPLFRAPGESAVASCHVWPAGWRRWRWVGVPRVH